MNRFASTIAAKSVRRAVARAARAGVRSWTGRSVVTSATDRVQPRYVTVAMHRTRVSEMRSSASPSAVVRAFRAPAASATTSLMRRRPAFAPSGG